MQQTISIVYQIFLSSTNIQLLICFQNSYVLKQYEDDFKELSNKFDITLIISLVDRPPGSACDTPGANAGSRASISIDI